jgi:hypothetical protein
MSGKRKKPFPYQPNRRVALEDIHDTGATTEEPLSESATKRQRNIDYEKIDPPFRAPVKKGTVIKWEDLFPILRVAGAIVGFFIAVVLPVVWYASKLDSNVDALKTDVRDVKQKTEELVKNSIKQGERLDGLERSINRSSERNRSPGGK